MLVWYIDSSWEIKDCDDNFFPIKLSLINIKTNIREMLALFCITLKLLRKSDKMAASIISTLSGSPYSLLLRQLLL